MLAWRNECQENLCLDESAWLEHYINSKAFMLHTTSVFKGHRIEATDNSGFDRFPLSVLASMLRSLAPRRMSAVPTVVRAALAVSRTALSVLS